MSTVLRRLSDDHCEREMTRRGEHSIDDLGNRLESLKTPKQRNYNYFSCIFVYTRIY